MGGKKTPGGLSAGRLWWWGLQNSYPLAGYCIHTARHLSCGDGGDVVSPGCCGFWMLGGSEAARNTQCGLAVNTEPFFGHLFLRLTSPSNWYLLRSPWNQWSRGFKSHRCSTCRFSNKAQIEVEFKQFKQEIISGLSPEREKKIRSKALLLWGLLLKTF